MTQLSFSKARERSMIPVASPMHVIPLIRMMFKAKIRPSELPAFRGAIVKKVGLENDLYHNHTQKGFHYRYPLIQYQWQNGHPVLLFVGAGTQQAEKLFAATSWSVHLNGRKLNMQIADLRIEDFQMEVQEGVKQIYTIDRWLALKPSKFAGYKTLKDHTARKNFLERILTGNMLSMAKGLGWHVKGKIETEIASFNDKPRAFMEGKKMVALQATFKSNMLLPDHIGLGKRPSLGFGIIQRLNA